MSTIINEAAANAVRELITRISRYEAGTKEFNNTEKQVITTLKKSDSMYFLTKKDIEKAISSMADKFSFHGYSKHAEHLRLQHRKYVDKILSEPDLTPQLNVLKFLLCMSQSPTTYFWKHPDEFLFVAELNPVEEVIDWGAYLNEGIERWSPTKEDSFDFSDSNDGDNDLSNDSLLDSVLSIRPLITETENIEECDFVGCRKELLSSIQNTWFSGDKICMKPPSEWFDANVGIVWENYLAQEVQGLVEIEPVTVISEYNVMREILWQMWGRHSSVVFQLVGDRLLPRSDVTISSIRAVAFKNFMKVFIPYIDLLDEFRRFCSYVQDPDAAAPRTYGSYARGLEEIVKPVVKDLIEVEDEIRRQDSTMTLLLLTKKIELIFKPLETLKVVHKEVTKDIITDSTLECSLILLTRLRNSLQFSLNKLDQDIRLTLYLQSLYYYFSVINAWLVKNELPDYQSEFVIVNKNVKNVNSSEEDWKMNFVLREDFCYDSYKDDGVIKIICEDVLKIGRNLHLLRLLEKYDVIPKDSETIHEKFVRLVLEELCKYYDCDKSALQENQTCKNLNSVGLGINETEDWANLVDVSDGFLSLDFDDFYSENAEVKSEKSLSLFEKISKITTCLFPLQKLPERIFSQIIKERFTISGLMVKNLLIDNYSLDKQLEFFSHIFLFSDDLIFPFYRRMFEKMSIASSNWGNRIWLTGHLQDVIMDTYPNFYEDCTVDVKSHWKQCRDSLDACTLINVQYDVKWPLNIVITTNHMRMYKDLFQFILKVKWALYTTNHLSFADIEPRKSKEIKSAHLQTITKRLKYLRFSLINMLNNIQHYVFGFIFNKSKIQFELDFEKAHDLKSLIDAHENYINSVYTSVMHVRDQQRNEHGFHTGLKCIKMLKVMWNKREYATVENLDKCYKLYKMSFSVVNSVVNPVYIFN